MKIENLSIVGGRDDAYDLIEKCAMDFFTGEAVKCIVRYAYTCDSEDLKKAQWCIDRKLAQHDD